jgi:hypothetical protein
MGRHGAVTAASTPQQEPQRAPDQTPRSRRTIPEPQMVPDALAEQLATCQGAGGCRLLAGTTSHDLRHLFASVLLAVGESVAAVAERLWREEASLLLPTYGGHPIPDSEDRTRWAVDPAVGGCRLRSGRLLRPTCAQRLPRL